MFYFLSPSPPPRWPFVSGVCACRGCLGFRVGRWAHKIGVLFTLQRALTRYQVTKYYDNLAKWRHSLYSGYRVQRGIIRGIKMLPLVALSASVSLLLIYLGAKKTMIGAMNLGNGLNLPKAVTGAIIVATVTALPELSSSLIIVMRGSHSMALGNILGTNIYNLPLLIGLAVGFG